LIGVLVPALLLPRRLRIRHRVALQYRRRWCGRAWHLRRPASSEPGDPAKEKLYYDAAFDLIKAKDFDRASQSVHRLSWARYPNSQYAGNAQYWLGEVNLAKG
jgi:hypothetical protein